MLAREAVTAAAPGRPLILESDDTTVVIPPGCGASRRDAAGQSADHLPKERAACIDPITFAVIKSALDTIVDDMAYTVMRTARSDDRAATCSTTRPRSATPGPHDRPGEDHGARISAPCPTRWHVLAEFGGDLAPGDVVIINDPYDGGMHLPDIFMFKPIFSDGERRGFAVVIAHQCDMGGRVPGSNASDSTEIYQEGLRIPPIKLYDGRRDETLGSPHHREERAAARSACSATSSAQYATCKVGERELLRLYAPLRPRGAPRATPRSCSTTASA